MNKLLFVLPHWNTPSEVWAQRMIEQLEGDIALIAAFDAEESWNDKIPAFRLLPPEPPKRLWQKVTRKLRNKIIRPKRTFESLSLVCKSFGIDKVLFNYATMPLQMQEFVDNYDAEMFVHCHGYDVAFNGRKDEWPYHRLHHGGYLKDLLALAEKVTFISNSKFTTENLVSVGISPQKIKQKYFGVECQDRFTLKDRTQRTKILHLGRLVDCKGPDLTIRAFELARSKGLDAELIIAGDGPLLTTCELLQRRSVYAKDIKILGAVSRERAQELFNTADIFTIHSNKGVLTNREEAFGVAIIEAMAAGLPVVAGKAGAISETVSDGKTGILFEPENIADQATAFIALGTNLDMQNCMGKEAWLVARSRFSVEKEKTELKKILNL